MSIQERMKKYAEQISLGIYAQGEVDLMLTDLQSAVRALERCGKIGNVLVRSYRGNAGKYGNELQELVNETLGKAGV